MLHIMAYFPYYFIGGITVRRVDPVFDIRRCWVQVLRQDVYSKLHIKTQLFDFLRSIKRVPASTGVKVVFA